MENIILSFSDIISDYCIESEEDEYNKFVQEAKITFIDASKLIIRDILFFLENDSVKRKYSYQWMNMDNTLIIRWDNAPHHRNKIDTHPHHKHVKTDKNIQSSPEMTLYGILSYIRGIILQ